LVIKVTYSLVDNSPRVKEIYRARLEPLVRQLKRLIVLDMIQRIAGISGDMIQPAVFLPGKGASEKALKEA